MRRDGAAGHLVGVRSDPLPRCCDDPSNGLVDELYLLIGPRIVAGDSPAFVGVPGTDLRLLDVRRWDGSGNVLLSYAVGR